MDAYFYEPQNGHGLPHDPFKAILAPRPIGWISSLDAQGRVNLAPYSFFNGFCSNPPVVGFSSEGRKDSVSNIEATGEFVCNLVTRPLAGAMNQTSAALPPGTDEMAFAGLAPAPSRCIRVPRVAAAGAAFECKLLQIVALKDLAGKLTGAQVVLGQVVGVHIAPDCLRDGIFDIVSAQTIARCGYRGDYAQVDSLFEMVRPKV